MDWPVVIIAVVLLVLLYVWWLARRIERLNARTAAALDALEDQLRRRAAAAAALGGPAREAALVAPNAGRPDTEGRQAAENDLVRALRQLPAQAAGDEELRAENRRLGVARQVYNDAVRDTRGLRTARIPRMFWLGRRGPLPEYFDVDELDLDAIEHDRREAAAVQAALLVTPRSALEAEVVPGVGEATAGPS